MIRIVRIFSAVVVVTAALVGMQVSPAAAGVALGSCTLSGSVNFTPPLSPTSIGSVASSSPTTSCTVVAPVLVAQNVPAFVNMTLPAPAANCEAGVWTGSVNVNVGGGQLVFTSTVVGVSNGPGFVINFVGGTGSGTIEMTVEPASWANCTTGSLGSASWSGRMTFEDPTLDDIG
jgi:hypothetical protein